MEMNYTDAELHQIEQELNIEILPGTEVMTDVGTHHFVKSNAGVLVPQPTADPHDPLNWSWKWKMSAIIASTSVTFVQGFGPLALAPTFGLYIEEWGVSLAQVIAFTGNAILVLGFSNFIWVPISSSFGRRPVLIFSNLICLASMIWRARAQSYNSFMGACILNGIGAGPAESIQPSVIADIFFLHDRGFWNTLYWTFYMGSLMVAPIVSGSMSTASLGWRPFWWLNVGIIGISLLLTIFGFPETKYHRPISSEISPGHGTASPAGSTNKDTSLTMEKTITRSDLPSLAPVDTAARDPHLGKGFPSKKQWGLYQPSPEPFKIIARELWVPWKLFAFPIVEFVSFVVSWSCSSFLTLNLTQQENFAAPPYNFSTQTIGFFNFAILIGAMIGLFTNGPFSDWVAKRQTLRNKGIREPEMRLLALVPYVIIMYIGNIVVSLGMQHKWHWAVIVCIGYAAAGIQVAAIPAIVSTYGVDSYRVVAGPMFVAVTVNKNLWGWGYSKFITEWIEESGYIPVIMTNASLILLWCLMAIPFYFFGKTFRRWTKNSSVHRDG